MPQRSKMKNSQNKGGNLMKMKHLQIGKTEFPMRGNLPTKEVDYQKNGKKQTFMDNVRKKNEGKPTFRAS